jgi:hypothetical protein
MQLLSSLSILFPEIPKTLPFEKRKMSNQPPTWELLLVPDGMKK